MSTKTFIWIGMVAGSTIGSLIPNIWNAGFLSFSSIIFSVIFGIFGIYLGFKIGNSINY